VLRRLSYSQQQLADMRVRRFGLLLARRASAFQLAAGTGARRA
jgi:hypothetical protein